MRASNAGRTCLAARRPQDPPPAHPASAPAGGTDLTLDEVATLKARVARLEQDLAATRAVLQRVCAELGMPNELWPENSAS